MAKINPCREYETACLAICESFRRKFFPENQPLIEDDFVGNNATGVFEISDLWLSPEACYEYLLYEYTDDEVLAQYWAEIEFRSLPESEKDEKMFPNRRNWKECPDLRNILQKNENKIKSPSDFF